MRDIERLVSELIAAQNEDESSFEAKEIAGMMSPDHRQKLLCSVTQRKSLNE